MFCVCDGKGGGGHGFLGVICSFVRSFGVSEGGCGGCGVDGDRVLLHYRGGGKVLPYGERI